MNAAVSDLFLNTRQLPDKISDLSIRKEKVSGAT